jgi:hypothetical protein
MKRFREGFTWNSSVIGMIGRIDYVDGEFSMVMVPFEHDTGQMLFRFMVEYAT